MVSVVSVAGSTVSSFRVVVGWDAATCATVAAVKLGRRTSPICRAVQAATSYTPSSARVTASSAACAPMENPGRTPSEASTRASRPAVVANVRTVAPRRPSAGSQASRRPITASSSCSRTRSTSWSLLSGGPANRYRCPLRVGPEATPYGRAVPVMRGPVPVAATSASANCNRKSMS